MTSTRSYRQSARADAVEATRARILDVAIDRFTRAPYDDVSLREIAAEAGVALQTVVNHFATKEGVFLAAIAHFQAGVDATRDAAAPGDIAGATAAVVADYERTGDSNLRALALEDRVPALHEALQQGRAHHRAWAERCFPAALAGRRGPARAERIALLAVATDVFTWRLLRHDHGLDADATARAMRVLVEALHPDPEEPAP